jgi:hypothetical protein
MNEIRTETVREALARIMQDRPAHGDGSLLRLWLRQVVFEVSPEGAPSCAVHELEGRRKLARELISLAVSSDLDRARDPSDDSADLAVERGRRRAVEPRSIRGAGRRV